MSNDAAGFLCASPIHFSAVEACESLNRRRFLRVKSVLDKAIASILLVLTSPIMLAAMLAVDFVIARTCDLHASSRGAQRCALRIYKIRSMFHACENQSGPWMVGLRWTSVRTCELQRPGMLVIHSGFVLPQWLSSAVVPQLPGRGIPVCSDRELSFQFEQRATSVTKEQYEFSPRRATLSFGYVAWNGDGAPSHLGCVRP